jgi:hypothetical protein
MTGSVRDSAGRKLRLRFRRVAIVDVQCPDAPIKAAVRAGDRLRPGGAHARPRH